MFFVSFFFIFLIIKLELKTTLVLGIKTIGIALFAQLNQYILLFGIQIFHELLRWVCSYQKDATGLYFFSKQ